MSSGKVWPYRLLAGCLILAAALLRILYLANNCPLDLAPDEAHYWDWSRHLDWCYYSKGPLVAYLIRGSCELAGGWSQDLTGSLMLAVRLPAILCSSLLLLSVYVLTVQVWRRDGLALILVALALTLPLLNVGAVVMTIDAPFACCWGWALVFGHRAVFRGSGWAWALTGLLIGLGILAKQTMVLWPVSFGLFLLITPAHRSLLFRRGFWVMTALALVCCLPILIWNLQHDWITLKHLSGHAGLQTESASISWTGPFSYLGLQFLVLLGFWFCTWVGAMIAYRPGKEPCPEARYLWWLSAPTFLFFLLFSLKNGGGEPNWPITAYLAGMVLTVGWAAEHWRTASGWYRRSLSLGLSAACAVGLLLTVVLHDSTLARPLLLQFAGPPSDRHPAPLRRVDPTCRLRGWRTLAVEVDRLRQRLRAQGNEPILAGAPWTLPGELGFYCEGRPQVYSVGLAMGDRHSQYDLWRPNPLDDPQAFSGRSFILVNAWPPSGAFERLEGPLSVSYSEDGQPIAQWAIWIGHGFRGFPKAPQANPY